MQTHMPILQASLRVLLCFERTQDSNALRAFKRALYMSSFVSPHKKGTHSKLFKCQQRGTYTICGPRFHIPRGKATQKAARNQACPIGKSAGGLGPNKPPNQIDDSKQIAKGSFPSAGPVRSNREKAEVAMGKPPPLRTQKGGFQERRETSTPDQLFRNHLEQNKRYFSSTS